MGKKLSFGFSSWHKGRYTRGSLLLKDAPETRSRVSTPTSTHEGDCSSNTLRNVLPGKYPNQYTCTRELAPETRSLKANFSTHEGACSWNRLVQQICPWSLLPHIKPVWYEGAKLGSKRWQTFCCATYFFARNRWCRWRSFAPGACCRSVLREQAPSCVPALKEAGQGRKLTCDETTRSRTVRVRKLIITPQFALHMTTGREF